MSHIRLDKEGMYNDQGKLVDMYIPRKCAVTNKVIHAKDAASVQLNIGEVTLTES
jgi:small subunit ribosomal protein S21e